jgi:molecular chaperone DnaK (HSP70)
MNRAIVAQPNSSYLSIVDSHGLDFGTTYSGFAFARESVPEDIRVEESWPGQLQAAGAIYQKTKTCVLYRDGKLVSWGWEAEMAALDMKPKEFKSSNTQLLEKFKLCLAEGMREAPNLPLGVSVEDVIQHYLKEISTLAKQRYKGAFGSISDRNIRW